MKYHILTLLISTSILAVGKPKETSDGLLILKTNENNSFKGQRLLDPVTCKIKVRRNDVTISLADTMDSFFIELPDSRTITGWIFDKKNKFFQPCFHSLSERKTKDWDLRLSRSNSTTDVLENCKSQSPQQTDKSMTVSTSISYLPNKEITDNCRKDVDKCRLSERRITISKGNGLTFRAPPSPSTESIDTGSNLTTSDLKINESERSHCQENNHVPSSKPDHSKPTSAGKVS